MNNLTELNTYSDTSVTYTDQGTGSEVLADRYQINGVLDTSKSVLENIEKICSSAGSWLSYDIQDGLWGVVINKSDSAVANFDDSNILGSISVTGTGLINLYNAVNVEFPHRNLRDSADFVNIEIPSGDRNANEPDNTLQITYDIINEPIQAQLLGFIELKQSRVDLIATFETDYSYYGLSAGDVITITNTQFGFSSKLFRIISIAEIQDGQGPLKLSITALEYDEEVYDETNLYRYTRSDSTGIITIGSIGIPGTPAVTKIEQDSRPRITVSATSPTGIVEGMEFWLTEDVSEPTDANRSYRLITTRYPTGNNSTFTSGTTVTFDYDNLDESDFLIKCRGFNTTTVGPYSDPSGLVNFNPVQITNAIDGSTLAINGTGGIVTALSVLELLSRLDGLWGPLGNAVANSSIFSQVFDLFKEETGYDLVGQTEAGNLVVAANVAVLNEGTTLTTSVGSINFVGNGIQATGSGSNVTVTIPAPGYLYELGDVQISSPTNSQLLSFNSTANKWVNQSYQSAGVITSTETYTRDVTAPGNAVIITGISPALSGANIYGGTQRVAAWLGNSASNTFGAIPPIRSLAQSDDPVTANVHVVPTTGSLWFNVPARIGWVADSDSFLVTETTTVVGEYWAADTRPIIANITKGGGSVYLYKSDGTLVETLATGDFNVNVNLIELPFANRSPDTDYYIQFDQDAVKYCNTSNVCIMSASDVRDSYSAWGYGNTSTPDYVIGAGAYGNSGYVVNGSPTYNAIWPFSTANSSVSAYSTPAAATLPIYNPPGYPPSTGGVLQIVSTSPAGYDTVTPGTTVTLTLTTDAPVTSKSGNVTLSRVPYTGNTVITTFNLANATVSGNIVTLGTFTAIANSWYAITVPANCMSSSNKTVSYTDPMCANASLTVSYSVTGPFPSYTLSGGFNTYSNDNFLFSYSLVGTSLSAVRIRSRITLQFNSFAYPTTGNIEIYKASDDSLVQSIPVDEIYTGPSSLGSYYGKIILPATDDTYGLFFSASSTTLGQTAYTVNLTSAFEPNTSYYMLIDAGSFEKLGYTSWPGVTSKTAITWTTTSN